MERTSEAITACFDAVIDEALWPAALQRLGESLDADSCTFAAGNARRDPLVFPRSTGHEDFAQLWLANQEHAPDPHVAVAGRLAREGRPYILETDVSTEDGRRDQAYYQLTAGPGRREWWAAICFSTPRSAYCMPLYRRAERGAFSEAEARAAARLRPQLARLVGLAETLANRLDEARLSVLESLNVAALTIESGGTVASRNSSAEGLLGGVLSLRRGRLVARHPDADRALREVIAAAQGNLEDVSMRHGALLGPPSGEDRLYVEALPLGRLGRDYFGGGRVLLTLRPIRSSLESRLPLIQSALGLTRGEARLVVAMMDGAGNADIAHRLGLSIETVRSNLRSIYLKTDLHARSEVVALVNRLFR